MGVKNRSFTTCHNVFGEENMKTSYFGYIVFQLSMNGNEKEWGQKYEQKKARPIIEEKNSIC